MYKTGALCVNARVNRRELVKIRIIMSAELQLHLNVPVDDLLTWLIIINTKRNEIKGLSFSQFQFIVQVTVTQFDWSLLEVPFVTMNLSSLLNEFIKFVGRELGRI